jgi:hypothetical protein
VTFLLAKKRHVAWVAAKVFFSNDGIFAAAANF